MKKINIGIIGCGYWGPNYVRIFNEILESNIKYCCDLNEENLSKIKKLYPVEKTTKDYRELVRDKNVDAVVITTPVNTHYEIVKDCLKTKKHILVEKPFTSTSKQAEELLELVKKNNIILMVGHVYEYNPGTQKLKEIIKERKLGDLYYIKTERIGLGPIRKQASALWDLATHDISIVTYLLDDLPISVTVEGESYIQKGIEDLVVLTLRFSQKIICTIYASWLAPEKIRKVTVVGSKGMAVFDDVNKTEMLKIYERKINSNLLNTTPQYSDHQNIVSIGDVYIPHIKQSEPLENQALHFLECISKNKKPLTDVEDGLNIIKILEAAEKSLRSKEMIKCQ